jgi:5-methyltetrahydrofolate--homocysteine methyltransferase
VHGRLRKIADCVIEGRFDEINALVEAALSDGVDPQTIVNDGLRSGMHVVGDKFKANEFFIPEVLIAARAMKAGMEVIKPHLTTDSTDSLGTVVIGTVQGDLHDIGKNLVAMMLEGAGFQVIDLGTDASPEAFVEAARENNAELVAMSALLTTTMPKMAETVHALNSADLDRTVRTMIGGAPITQSYANEIGADAYAPEAASAVDAARQLVARVSRPRGDGPPCWPQHAFARRLKQDGEKGRRR